MEKEEDIDERPTAEFESPKAKSCKGCLYYSSILRSDGRNPRCVGLPKTLNTVPGPNLVGESEMEASKEGRNLSDFKYVCVGYSVFLENNGSPTELQTTKAELPFCVGLEVLIDRRVSSSDGVHTHANNREDGHTFSKPKAHPMGEEFLTRFKRNASLIAWGVARNVQRVGNHVKDYVDDMLYPYRRRPK
ncbi:uncharacterized protein [Aristolochia californica]|uniref:uncharacterized protein n=1 Tax=Aristolochia californica TaxID=171875 RepID=UPI0035DBE4B5